MATNEKGLHFFFHTITKAEMCLHVYFLIYCDRQFLCLRSKLKNYYHTGKIKSNKEFN